MWMVCVSFIQRILVWLFLFRYTILYRTVRYTQGFSYETLFANILTALAVINLVVVLTLPVCPDQQFSDITNVPLLTMRALHFTGRLWKSIFVVRSRDNGIVWNDDPNIILLVCNASCTLCWQVTCSFNFVNMSARISAVKEWQNLWTFTYPWSSSGMVSLLQTMVRNSFNYNYNLSKW